MLDHWVVSVDMPQLFAPAALGLPKIQAEQTFFLGTRERAPRSDGVIPIDVEGQMLRAPGGGFMRAGGTVEYRVWAPAAGSYRLDFQARGTGTISTTVGSSAYSTPVDTPTSWQLVAGPTVTLAKGVNTIRLTGSGWSLDWFTLTK